MDIVEKILSENEASLSEEQILMLREIISKQEFIVIDKPNDEDIEFFSRQAGITEAREFDKKYVPSAHGARTKNDGLIHIYPHSLSFESMLDSTSIIEACKNDIIIHEIFHYIIRPNLSEENETIKEEFGHFLTEGLVQRYAERFALEHGLATPHSGYGKNVQAAEYLISGFPKELNRSQIDKMVFNLNQDELLEKSSNGKALYEEFAKRARYNRRVSKLIRECFSLLDNGANEQEIIGVTEHFKRIDDPSIVHTELEKYFHKLFIADEPTMNEFMEKLDALELDDPMEFDEEKRI